MVADRRPCFVDDVIPVDLELEFVGLVVFQDEFDEALFAVAQGVMFADHGKWPGPAIPAPEDFDIIANEMSG